jgi:hypothetical protein
LCTQHDFKIHEQITRERAEENAATAVDNDRTDVKHVGRARNAPLKHLSLTRPGAFSASFRVQGPSSKQGKVAAMLIEGVSRQSAPPLSTRQGYSVIRDQQKDSISHHLEDLSRLPSLLLLLKKKDPFGIYSMTVKALSYEVDGASSSASEFVSLIVVPSYLQTFANNSEGKLQHIDMAHPTGRGPSSGCKHPVS